MRRPLARQSAGERPEAVTRATSGYRRASERKGGREGFGEAPAVSVPCEELLDHETEAPPRVRLRESLVHHGPAGMHLFRERLGGQDPLGREAPVQRGRTDWRRRG